MPRRIVPALAFGLTLALVVSGCDETPAPKPKPAASNAAPPKNEHAAQKPPAQIKDAKSEITSGAAVKAPSKVVSRDPFRVVSSVYVSTVGQAKQFEITSALRLYQGENNAYPASADEFFEKIIKANGIKLPALPKPNQKYGYDVDKHEMYILEYPE